jgi:hypothetical protein
MLRRTVVRTLRVRPTVRTPQARLFLSAFDLLWREFGAAHAPSPDARYEHPVLRSLGCRLRFGILPALGGIRRLLGHGQPLTGHPAAPSSTHTVCHARWHTSPERKRGDPAAAAADGSRTPSAPRSTVGSRTPSLRTPARVTIVSSYPARWCNGSTRDFGSLCLGSNPSRAIVAGILWRLEIACDRLASALESCRFAESVLVFFRKEPLVNC